MNYDKLSMTLPDGSYVRFDAHEISSNTTNTVQLNLQSGCVKLFIDGIKFGDTCSHSNWWYRLTYRFRRWNFYRDNTLSGSNTND